MSEINTRNIEIIQKLDYAQQEFKQGNIQEATILTTEIIDKDPSQAKAWLLLSNISVNQNLFDKALEYIKRAILEDPSNCSYYIHLGNLLKQDNKITAARNNFLKALQLDEKSFEAIYSLGILELENGELNSSYKYFTKYNKLNPDNFSVYNNLGCICIMSNQTTEAVEYFNKAISLNSTNPDAYSNLGNIYFNQDQIEKAKEYYDQAIKLKPDFADANNNLGNYYKKTKDLIKAEELYLKTIELNQSHSEAHNNLGAIYIEKNLHNKAIPYLKKAIKISKKFAEAYHNLGLCYIELEEFKIALNNFNTAQLYNPNNYETVFYIGRCCDILGKVKEAINAYQASLDIYPEYTSALICLSTIYRKYQLLDPAMAILDKIIKINPENSFAIYSKAFIYQKQCAWEKLNAITSQLITIANKYLETNEEVLISPFEASALPLPEKIITKIIKRASAFSKLDLFTKQKFIFKRSNNSNNSNSIIKLGYISPDFNEHPVGLLLRDLFSYHDRNKFHITGYNLVKNSDNSFTKQIANSCDQFIDVHDYGKLKIAEQIYADNIDILIDLAGHTGNSLPQVFAYQPAPIQCHWIGSVNSMQADFMQYAILDKNLVTDKIRKQFSENIIYLPDSAFATPSFTQNIPSCNRKDYYLPEDKFIFCCFTQSYRILPEVFNAWLEILKQAPNSILWLRADHEIVRKNLSSHARDFGIDPERIIFTTDCMLNHKWHHQLADLWLDTFTLTSGTGSFLSLWANVPILTYASDSTQSRVAASLLKACQLDQLVCESSEDYIKQAIYYYHNTNKLKNIRDQIKTNKNSYPIFNPKKLIINLESSLEYIWSNYQSGKHATDCQVSDYKVSN